MLSQHHSPIESNTKDMCVEFGKHEFGEPKYSVDECKERDVSYQAPLFRRNPLHQRETGEIKEQDVFMGDFPLMTNRGTFIINGTERVVVSQLVRSPGVYFSAERDKTSDKTIYNAKIIPRVAHGSSSRPTSATCSPYASTASVSSPRRFFCAHSALPKPAKRSSTCSVIARWLSVRSTGIRHPREEALIELYRRFRPGEPPTIDSARSLLEGLFFNPQRYDLAKVGRYKINKKLGIENDSSTLTDEDIIAAMRYIVGLHDGATATRSTTSTTSATVASARSAN